MSKEQWGLRWALARDPHEEGRTASPLELFFDLVFVVAVSLASQNLHHFESDQQFGTAISRYLMIFFAIWWAWMNFTWYATGFAIDDWLYRILSLVQMAGALVLAAGVPSAMQELDFTLVIVGYVIMRLAMVAQWLRAAHDNPGHRRMALTYAIGIALVQVLWVGWGFVPTSWQLATFTLFVSCELAVPVLANRLSAAWHPHHVAERYGLFTLIVLGESILAASTSIVEAFQEESHYGDLILLAMTGFLIVAGMWWVYFEHPQGEELAASRKSFRWGYGHYFIFASAAAVSAGIEVALDYDTRRTGLEAARAAAALCVPVAVFVGVVWGLMVRPQASSRVNVVMPLVAAGILLAVFLPYSLQIAAALMVVIVVVMVLDSRGREPAHHGQGTPPRVDRTAA